MTAALQYRLVSPWTNWLVVAPSSEDEKAYDVPILHNAIQKSEFASYFGRLPYRARATLMQLLERLKVQ